MQHIRCITDEEREHPCHQINSGHYHCSRMNQCADRRRTFHCIRQPDVQREHRTLSGTTDEHQPEGQGNHRCTTFQQCHFAGLEGICASIITVNKDTDQESQVGKAGNDERLFACRNSGRLRIVETDEQIG